MIAPGSSVSSAPVGPANAQGAEDVVVGMLDLAGGVGQQGGERLGPAPQHFALVSQRDAATPPLDQDEAEAAFA
jgi:hypothetical protein